MKSEKSLLWIFGGLAAAFLFMLLATDLPLGFFNGGAAKPVPGTVYELTEENIAAARRDAPVLVALFTTKGNIAGARMARTLNGLAGKVKDRAIVATGNLADEPGLASRAGLDELPAWIVYRDGNEVARSTGENADLAVSRFIEEHTGRAP
jgi:thioredoxin-like negative regulator of GroEL